MCIHAQKWHAFINNTNVWIQTYILFKGCWYIQNISYRSRLICRQNISDNQSPSGMSPFTGQENVALSFDEATITHRKVVDMYYCPVPRFEWLGAINTTNTLYQVAHIADESTYPGEYQIIVHFDVPHLIHVIWSGYCAHYRYGVVSPEEGMIKLILTHYGLIFSWKITKLPQLAWSIFYKWACPMVK